MSNGKDNEFIVTRQVPSNDSTIEANCESGKVKCEESEGVALNSARNNQLNDPILIRSDGNQCST